jgi:hypothetical protein
MAGSLAMTEKGCDAISRPSSDAEGGTLRKALGADLSRLNFISDCVILN